MLSVFGTARNITFLSTLVRLLIASLSGGIIGIERSAKNRPAGFRTHILVAIGAAAASLTGHYIYLEMQLPADITRLGAQVITGLGFLGAGTIIVTNRYAVKGLTTAAGLWTTGIIGLSYGAGFYEGGLLGTVLVILTENVFSEMGRKIHRVPDFRMTLYYTEKDALDQVMRYCKDKKLAIIDLQVTTLGEGATLEYKALLSMRPNGSIHYDDLLNHIHTIAGVSSATI